MIKNVLNFQHTQSKGIETPESMVLLTLCLTPSGSDAVGANSYR